MYSPILECQVNKRLEQMKRLEGAKQPKFNRNLKVNRRTRNKPDNYYEKLADEMMLFMSISERLIKDTTSFLLSKLDDIGKEKFLYELSKLNKK